MNTGARIVIAAISSLVIASGASLAHADPAKSQLSDISANHNTPPDTKSVNPQPVHRSLQWDPKGRWSLRLDMSEPVGREMQLNDVQAGAFFRVTPTLRVGGAFAFGDGVIATDHVNIPQAQAPRVKLETNFKF